MTISSGYFITGTDTDIGKTLIAATLLHQLTRQGLKAIGMKPIAAGATLIDKQWHNEDVAQLRAVSNIDLPQKLTTPYLMQTPVAPHIAAELENIVLDPAQLHQSYRHVTNATDWIIVEGIGGFCVPLNTQYDTADFAQQLNLPIIMVVGLRLGCLNHALLTAQAIQSRGLLLAGWVANLIDPCMPYIQSNIHALQDRLAAPLLGYVPRLKPATPANALQHLDFNLLVNWPSALSS